MKREVNIEYSADQFIYEFMTFLLTKRTFILFYSCSFIKHYIKIYMVLGILICFRRTYSDNNLRFLSS